MNETSWKRPERIPKTMMSKPYQAKIIEQLHIVINEQVASMAILECNKTVQTSMVWFAYEVDADSHNKYQMYYLHRLSCKKVSMELWKSCLKFRSFFTRSLWVTINQNPDQWNGSKLPVKFNQHTRTYLEIWTSQTGLQIWSWNRSRIKQRKLELFVLLLGFPELPLYQTAHTYFNVTKSPLVPGFIKGSVAKVSSILTQLWITNSTR